MIVHFCSGQVNVIPSVGWQENDQDKRSMLDYHQWKEKLIFSHAVLKKRLFSYPIIDINLERAWYLEE